MKEGSLIVATGWKHITAETHHIIKSFDSFVQFSVSKAKVSLYRFDFAAPDTEDYLESGN